ncbi:MAG: RNA polymerase sigma factor [Kofleriaceae bacterium]
MAPRELPPARPRAAELDEVTLRRAQRGEPAACRALVDRYSAPLFALLGRLLGGSRDADRRALIEDLAQDTFLAVFRGLGDFSPSGPAKLSSWILTIASRRAIDELRRRGGARVRPIASAEIVAAAIGPSRADAELERRRLATAIDHALAELAPPYRAAFLLYELHGLDYGEIARALEIDVGTVKSRLARARAALRAALREVHHG